jgi:C4-dicarboxylate transporter, DctM subunit
VELWLIVTIVVVVLLTSLVKGVPIALGLALAGGLGILLLDGFNVMMSTFSRVPFQQASRFSLIVIPMFILMGVAARHARIAEEAFNVLAWVLRRVPGGLALATVLACAGFAAVSGSSVATVVSVGNTAIAEMRRYGYARHVAAGVVGAAGTLGVLIPPSVPLVIYGILTGESIGVLLLAGLVPGLLSAVMYGAAIIVRARRHPEDYGGAEDVLTLATRPKLKQGTIGISKIAILFAIVIGGLYTGLFTAVEASAVGAFAAVLMVFGSWIRSPKDLYQRLRDTVTEAVSLNGMGFALLIGGAIFSGFTVAAGLPQAFTRAVLGLELPGYAVILVLLLVLLPMGMFLDPLSIMLIMVPLTFPLVDSLGFDGIWYGILFVKFIELGLITPPLGINAFVVAGTSPELTPEIAFKGVLQYLTIDLMTIALIFVFPAIVTFLPALVNG